jgi:hypothetical protein
VDRSYIKDSELPRLSILNEFGVSTLEFIEFEHILTFFWKTWPIFKKKVKNQKLARK